MGAVDWGKVGDILRDLGGWENTRRAPDPDHGAEPIADRPGCWGWRPAVPEWMRDVPEPAPAAPPVPDTPAAEAPRVDSYGTVPQPSGQAGWMFGVAGED